MITVTPEGHRAARWGAGTTWHWDWGARFGSINDVLAYDPLEHMDQRGKGVVAEHDYQLSVEDLAAELQASLDAGAGCTGSIALVTGGFYNTLFMWPQAGIGHTRGYEGV